MLYITQFIYLFLIHVGGKLHYFPVTLSIKRVLVKLLAPSLRMSTEHAH